MRKLIARIKHWLDIENPYSDYDKDAYSYGDNQSGKVPIYWVIVLWMAIAVVAYAVLFL